jgi:hypothetical protein
MLDYAKQFINYIKWLYLQYLLNTALYMLEPAERMLFNVILILVLATAIYSTLVFLPSQLTSFSQYIGLVSTSIQ